MVTVGDHVYTVLQQQPTNLDRIRWRRKLRQGTYHSTHLKCARIKPQVAQALLLAALQIVDFCEIDLL